MEEAVQFGETRQRLNWSSLHPEYKTNLGSEPVSSAIAWAQGKGKVELVGRKLKGSRGAERAGWILPPLNGSTPLSMDLLLSQWINPFPKHKPCLLLCKSSELEQHENHL